MSAGLDRLHPVVVHHIVNTLGWTSLHALQEEAAGPVLDGTDALLLAPTAGGKTEAAVFPLLTAMQTRRWSGLSVIYVCPLKALLNNLLPRLETYAGWLGRRVAVWHGDVTASARQRILRGQADRDLQLGERFVDPPLICIGQAEVQVAVRVVGLELDRVPVLFDRHVLRVGREEAGQVVVGGRAVRFE